MEPQTPDIIPAANAEPNPPPEGLTPPLPAVPEPDIIVPPPPRVEPPPAPLAGPEQQRVLDLIEFDQQTVYLLNQHQATVDKLEGEYNEINDECKKAKRAWETKVEELQAFIRERREARGKPVQKTLLNVFPTAPDGPPPVAPLPAPAADPNATALDNLWREFPLARLTQWGATENDVAKLADGQRKRGLDTRVVRTVGEMADYTGRTDFEQRLTDFMGVGNAAAKRVEDALEQFWGWWNRGGQAEYATERGITSATQPQAVDPAPDAGAGSADHGGGDQRDAGEPVGAAVGDAGVYPVHADTLPAAQPEPDADATFEPPADGPDEYALHPDGGEG